MVLEVYDKPSNKTVDVKKDSYLKIMVLWLAWMVI